MDAQRIIGEVPGSTRSVNNRRLAGDRLNRASSTAGNATITNAGGSTTFSNASTAGNATITNNDEGEVQFVDGSTAGNAVITNTGGFTYFYAGSTAGNATITNNATGGTFFVSATAANAFIRNTGGSTIFEGSTAANAFITNTAASTRFEGTSTAGTATLLVNRGDLFYSAATRPRRARRLLPSILVGA